MAESKDLSLSDLWLMIRKHRILLLCVTLGSAALGFGYGIHSGKTYTATGEIQIQPGAASGLKSASGMIDGGLSSLDDVMETDVAIIESPSLLIDVAKSLKLQENKDFIAPGSTVTGPNGAKLPLWHGDLNNPYVRHAIVGALKGGLVVARVPRTELISISYTSDSPSLAADIVDGVETTYVEENFKSHFESRNQVSKWLTEQIDDLRNAVQSSQDRVVDLQRRLGINAFDPQHTLAVGEL
ncbi:MAG TPA: Wzz/FepE/Etk N-terminal domain-containing protein, partial [Acidobacteriaceae bacterium]|nr:Wzz/FepE/Etk N-terminal domain-containing protein [Acidobacteriaceae bacterium]